MLGTWIQFRPHAQHKDSPDLEKYKLQATALLATCYSNATNYQLFPVPHELCE